ncbi:hypothetical protein Sru01_57930 [Sphaerisporangium rufum]|uniref:Uncharacterized protein n=1 Tax=Sphaerisporangium rufum TaxID=1381558 RepID=A0A919R6X8_9ACTN|nr:hypothetical protein [Sphaerisporangium rufum]GII80811.1 hypothetical protein Sru01_57930 [Sphaerisporangium rufum]
MVDLDALRRGHVAALGGVGRPDLDGGVGPIGGDETDVAGGDVEDGRDGGGVSNVCVASFSIALFLMPETLRCLHEYSKPLVA